MSSLSHWLPEMHWHPEHAMECQSCTWSVLAANPVSTLLPHPAPLHHCSLACRMGLAGSPVNSFSRLDGSLGRRALVGSPLGERLFAAAASLPPAADWAHVESWGALCPGLL